MKLITRILLLSALLFTGVLLEAQQYFVVQKRGELKNFKYVPGNKIHLKTLRGGYEVAGEITTITDTTLVISNLSEVGISNIAMIYRKSGFLNRLSNIFFIQGGIAYFLIAGANAAINNESPIIDESTLLISGTMVATGFAIKPFVTRKLDTTTKWELKILNFDEFKKE